VVYDKFILTMRLKN